MRNHRLTNTQLRDLGTRVEIGTKGFNPIPQLSPVTNQAVEEMLRKRSCCRRNVHGWLCKRLFRKGKRSCRSISAKYR